MSIIGDDTLETTLNVKGMAFQSAQNPFFNVQDAASDNKLAVGSDGVTTVKSLVATTADINAGTIDNTVVGATTPADATFSTVTVNDSLVLNTHLAIAGDSNNTTLGVTGTLNQTANLFNVSQFGVGNDKLTVSYDGITTATSLVATTADINSGTIDATTVGVTTPASAIFTTLTSNDALTVNSHAVVTGDNALQTTFKVRGAVVKLMLIS